MDDPFALWLLEPSPLPGAWVAATLCAVPHPLADVLLVIEHPADGGGGPPLRRLDPAGDALGVEGLNDAGDGLAVGVFLEDPKDGRRLTRLDLHPIAVGAGATLLVHSHLAHGNRPVSHCPFSNGEATTLLPELAS